MVLKYYANSLVVTNYNKEESFIPGISGLFPFLANKGSSIHIIIIYNRLKMIIIICVCKQNE